MKKLIIVLLLLAVFFSIGAFILIPKQLTVSEATLMKANENAVFRYLSSEEKWIKWWPKENVKSLNQEKGINLNGLTYHLATIVYNAVNIKINYENSVYNGEISLISLSSDSIAVQSKIELVTSNNPFKRFLQYEEAKKIKNSLATILAHLKSYCEDKDKVYAFNIRKTTLKDTALIAIKTVVPNYPSTQDIYKLVENLEKYLRAHNARQVGAPMLNIREEDSAHYELMVAIPTDKRLDGDGNISSKRLIIYKDKVLTAEVQGGPEIIKKAYNELTTFMSDYNLATPVISWESLITDRSKEKDSTKWVTKIFVPIV